MTPSTKERRQRRAPGDLVRTVSVAYLIVAGAALGSLVAGDRLMPTPPVLPQITLVNPTDYDLEVEIRGAGDGWMDVATAQQRAATVAREVLHVGDRWLFRFRGQGEEGGELRLSAAHLERQGWRVEIPAEVGDRLRARGAPPPP